VRSCLEQLVKTAPEPDGSVHGPVHKPERVPLHAAEQCPITPLAVGAGDGFDMEQNKEATRGRRGKPALARSVRGGAAFQVERGTERLHRCFTFQWWRFGRGSAVEKTELRLVGRLTHLIAAIQS
jgi:hypothetical protein